MNRESRRSIVRILSLLLALGAGLLIPRSVAAQLTPLPAGTYSSIEDNTYNPKDPKSSEITDAAFAALMKNFLIKNGTSNAKDATFLFQSCFGGGMLSGLQSALGNTVSWAGGSASAFNQPAWGAPLGADTTSPWTGQLANGLHALVGNGTVQAAIKYASTNDPASKGKAPFIPAETPQSIVGGAGGSITLKDPDAKSHIAILWAGIVNPGQDKSILDDIQRMDTVLTRAWGTGSNVDIIPLVGKNATLNNLMKTLNGLAPSMNNTEQFVFYASDHGDSNVVLPGPKPVNSLSTDTESFSLSSSLVAGLKEAPQSFPFLDVSYDGVTAPAPVSFDGQTLGTLTPGLTNETFAIPLSLIQAANQISIYNPGDTSFTINSKIFSTGPNSLLAPVPEPSSLHLLLVAGVIVSGGWVFRRIRA